MQFHVRAVPRAKKAEVMEVGEGQLRVRVDAPAEGGRANERLVEILADYWGVSKRAVRLIRGEHSRDKVIEVESG